MSGGSPGYNIALAFQFSVLTRKDPAVVSPSAAWHTDVKYWAGTTHNFPGVIGELKKPVKDALRQHTEEKANGLYQGLYIFTTRKSSDSTLSSAPAEPLCYVCWL